jgi:uncharacterized protein involved in exopolysaccharide biosynthesis
LHLKNWETFDVTGMIEIRDPEAAKIDDVLAALRRRWWLIAIVCLLCTGAMIGLAFWMTPIYRGATILGPAHTDKNGLGSGLGSALGSVQGFAALAGIGTGEDSATDEALAVLSSQDLTQRFISDNNLMPDLFAGLWDSRTGKWKQGIKKIPTLARGYKVFKSIRKIERDNKTGLITLNIDWRDRVKAADWTNRLVKLLNDEMRNRAIIDAEASLGYLQKEYGTTADVSTREAISKLIESQVKQQMFAHVTQEYALRVIDKALISDADAPVKPNKILFTALGLFLGTLCGIALALLLYKRELSRIAKRGLH